MKIPGDKWFPHPTLLVAYLQSSSFTSVFKNNLSMKEGCLFFLSLWDLPNQGSSCCTFGRVGNPSMTRCAPSWFHNVSTYCGEVIEDWKKNSLKFYLNQK